MRLRLWMPRITLTSRIWENTTNFKTCGNHRVTTTEDGPIKKADGSMTLILMAGTQTGNRAIDSHTGLPIKHQTTMNFRDKRVSGESHHMALILTALILTLGQIHTPSAVHMGAVSIVRLDSTQTVPRSSKASSNWLVPLVTSSSINSKVRLKSHQCSSEVRLKSHQTPNSFRWARPHQFPTSLLQWTCRMLHRCSSRFPLCHHCRTSASLLQQWEREDSRNIRCHVQ